jgi:S-adenosylmethionine synthetase
MPNRLNSRLFTSESVTSGHPDKICDLVSDTLVDAHLAQDPLSKIALDTWVKDNKVGVIGELTTTASVNVEALVREAVNSIGYNSDELGFNGDTCDVIINIGQQSREINAAVVNDLNIGAGDQGLMFGFACDQTEELMPLPMMLSHRLAEQLEKARRDREANNDFSLRPDGKTQVTIEYDDRGKVSAIDTILISTQHAPNVTSFELMKILTQEVIYPVIELMGLEQYYKSPKLFINPSGSFVLGGPVADSGLTGRKIVVDGYGGYARVGGGAFSGKDPTKVDRSGAYAARQIAKSVVAKGMAKSCEVQVSYAIGVAEPTSLSVFGDLHVSEGEIIKYIRENFDMRPRAIIERLRLNRPIYAPTSSYGHFGRKPENGFFTWEEVV